MPTYAVRSLLIAAAAVTGLGLPRAEAADAPAPASLPAACTDLATLPANLTVEPRDIEATRQTLVFAPESDAGLLRLHDVMAVLGPCASHVRNFRGATLVMDDDTTGVVIDGGAVRSARPYAPGWDQVYSWDRPVVPGAEFIRAARVDTYQGAEDIVSVWRKGETWQVVAYQVVGTRVSAPTLIMTSTRPLLGVGYFPAPDAAIGGLGLVQVVDGEVRVIGIHWSHPGVFPRPGRTPAP